MQCNCIWVVLSEFLKFFISFVKLDFKNIYMKNFIHDKLMDSLFFRGIQLFNLHGESFLPRLHVFFYAYCKLLISVSLCLISFFYFTTSFFFNFFSVSIEIILPHSSRLFSSLFSINRPSNNENA